LRGPRHSIIKARFVRQCGELRCGSAGREGGRRSASGARSSKYLMKGGRHARVGNMKAGKRRQAPVKILSKLRKGKGGRARC
jgi:hypothetical protein